MMRPGAVIRSVIRSVAFYPLTMMYIGASTTLIAVTCGALSLAQGLGMLAFLTAVAMLAGTRRELRRVHSVVSESHAALMRRNVQLEQLLEASNRQWDVLMDTARALDQH